MIQGVRFGVCNVCNRDMYTFSFSIGPVRLHCGCTEEPATVSELINDVDRAHSFDKQVHAMHHEMLEELDGMELSEISMHLSASVGNAQTAILNGDFKAARAFLLRVAVLSRYMSVDQPDITEDL